MEEEYIFFLGLVALGFSMGTKTVSASSCPAVLYAKNVCGHTPTFRNEATHPLKAPTESTLGLQMSDESVGRTRSNPSKADAYSTGGKHFEYLVLNDSSVLLTSLQNDNLDVAAAQQTGPANDTSTTSNFLSHDNARVRLWPFRVINNGWRSPEMDKVVSKSRNLYPSQLFQYGDITARRSENSFKPRGPFRGTKRAVLLEMAEFANGRGKISSTTKLYSRQPNRTENFATFTSPLAANKVQVGDKEETVPPSASSEPPQSKMAQTVAPGAQKQSFDYDDSFTKLLISNGILKPENKSIQQTTLGAVPFKSGFLPQESKDSSPSAEDVSRIMDGNILRLTQNDSLSRILKLPPRQIAESLLEHGGKISIQPTETTLQATNSTLKMFQPVSENTTQLTHLPIRKLNTNGADLIKNISVLELKLGTGGIQDSKTESVPSLAILSEELTTATTFDSNFTSTSDTAPTIDTSLSTSTPADKFSIHLEKRLIRTYESTSQAKTIPSEFVHTDQSNENPLSAKAYTDIVSNVDSETENSPFASQPLLQHSEYDPEDDHDVDHQFPVLNRFLVDYQALDRVKRLKSTGKPPQFPQPPQALTLEQHILSVSEFKGLIEDSIRHLFYFVARFIREQNLLTPQMLLENSSANNRVTLKRFGFVSIMQAFNGTEDFDRYDISSWRDIADGSLKKVNVPLNKLFDDTDNENARWIVFTSANNSTYESMQNGIVTPTDYTLAARLSLEYCGLKINAIIALPSRVATNVTLPESEESSIDVNEELLIEEPAMSATNVLLEMGAGRYRVLQLFSKYSQAWTNTQASKMRSVDFEYQHEDVEFYIFVLGGAVCIFSILSPMLYGIYKIIHAHRMHSSSSTPSFRLPSIFRRDKFQYQQSHEKMPESRCESLNVIFSEEFDRKYSSWFDNTHHSSSILKPSADGGSTSGGPYNDDSLDDYPEFSDLTRNVCENNSPRLSKENRLNMGCRPACVLLPHPATYLIQNEKEERYFDNPNYSR